VEIILRDIAPPEETNAVSIPLRDILLAELQQESGLRHFHNGWPQRHQYDIDRNDKRAKPDNSDTNEPEWPADPKDYPLTTFDFGIGIGQLTSAHYVNRDIYWDWKRNLRQSAWVMFHEKMLISYNWLTSPTDKMTTDQHVEQQIWGLWLLEPENLALLSPKPTMEEKAAFEKVIAKYKNREIADEETTLEQKARRQKKVTEARDGAEKEYNTGDKKKRDAYKRPRGITKPSRERPKESERMKRLSRKLKQPLKRKPTKR
jgi:hypothetical protein